VLLADGKQLENILRQLHYLLATFSSFPFSLLDPTRGLGGRSGMVRSSGI
jgi:hypothetical protein